MYLVFIYIHTPSHTLSSPSLLSQSVHKQQQLQHEQFQRQLDERLDLLRRQPFPPPGTDLPLLAPDADSDHSSPNGTPNITPRASNHSNLSVPELGSSANEHEDGGMEDTSGYTH